LATRKSLFNPPPNPPEDAPKENKDKFKRRLMALKMVQMDLSSTANGCWDTDSCVHLDAVFADRGYSLKGSHFITELGNLMTTAFPDSSSISPNYSWLDIATHYTRPQPYSWHADSAVPCQDTVMLGFPKVNNYVGSDVFSHIAVQTPPQGDGSSPVVVQTDEIDPSTIYKPVYSKRNEILVYRDSEVLHTAPDKTHRDGVWRFM
jgi:hypothetical protein